VSTPFTPPIQLPDDDVAVVYITTHGRVVPTYNVAGGISFLAGRPLFSGLSDIEVHKINAVSPGTCNFMSLENTANFVTHLTKIFGYEIDTSVGPPINASESVTRISHRYTEAEKVADNGYVDVFSDFAGATRAITHLYQLIDVDMRPAPISLGTAEQRKNYDVEEHAYHLYKMTSDTLLLNKEFSLTQSEYDYSVPYDWNITIFDSSGPRSILKELWEATKIKASLSEDPTFITSTAEIVSYLHSIGKRRIFLVDMTCSVSQSSHESSTSDLSHDDTSGRGAIRAIRNIPHG